MLYVKTLKSVPYLDPDWLEESAEVKVVCINDGYQHRVSKLALAAFSPTFLEALLGTGIATFAFYQSRSDMVIRYQSLFRKPQFFPGNG